MRFDPLIGYLLFLTVSTGLIDALSVLALGHVFTANMTGNVVFMGFALAGWSEFSLVLCGVSAAGFLTGSLLGGKLTVGLAAANSRPIVLRCGVAEFLLQVPALALLLSAHQSGGHAGLLPAAPLFLIGAAMGVRNASARKLAIPDLTTTVLTLTLAGIAADSSLAGGANPRLARRLLAVAAMFTGACLGALLVRFGHAAELLAGSAAMSLAAALLTAGTLRSREAAAALG